MIELVSRYLWRAWRTLGIPTAIEPVDEVREGIIDPEALIVLTLRYEPDARMLENVAAWSTANADLLLTQKLAFLMAQKRLSASHVSDSRASELSSLPTKLRKALGIRGSGSPRRVSARISKLAPRSAIAESSHVLFNRLLYGVSARADIIAAHEIRGLDVSGAELAQLLAIDASTVSRVRKDLRDCGVLDDKGLHIGKRRFPAYFVSARTVSALPRLLDAARARDPSLRKAMIPSIDRRLDALSYLILRNGR